MQIGPHLFPLSPAQVIRRDGAVISVPWQEGAEVASDWLGHAGTLVTTQLEQDGCALTLERFTAADGSVLALRLSVRNSSAAPMYLDRIIPLAASAPQDLRVADAAMQHWNVLRAARQKNDIPGVFRPAQDDHDWQDALFDSSEITAGGGVGDQTSAAVESMGISSDPYIAIARRDDQGSALLIGALGQSLHLNSVWLETDDARERLTALRVECLFDGCFVPAGDTRQTHWIVLRDCPDLVAAMDIHARYIAQVYDVQPPPTPPSIYSTWYYYNETFDDADLDENLAAMRNRHVPFDVLMLDSGWWTDFGTWDANDRFPRGMASVADRIREAGFAPGIWTCPLIVAERSPILQSHPDLVARDHDGNPVPFGYKGDTTFVLDPTAPSARAYIRDMYAKIRGWGFHHHKLDFLRSVLIRDDIAWHDPTQNRASVYRLALELVREAIGDDYLLACGGLFEGTAGLADAMRSGSDVKGFWDGWVKSVGPEASPHWLRTGLPRTYKQTVFRNATRCLWHVDPDALMLRHRDVMMRPETPLSIGRLTDEEAFAWVANQYTTGALVCVSERLVEISSYRLDMLRQIMPVVNPPARPMDIAHPNQPTRFLTRLETSWGAWWTLALFNFGGESVTQHLTLRELGLPAGDYAIMELRTQHVHELQTAETAIDIVVPSHGARVLRITPWTGAPVLLGTDLHLAGGAEFQHVAISDDGTVDARFDSPWPDAHPTLTIGLPHADRITWHRHRL